MEAIPKQAIFDFIIVFIMMLPAYPSKRSPPCLWSIVTGYPKQWSYDFFILYFGSFSWFFGLFLPVVFKLELFGGIILVYQGIVVLLWATQSEMQEAMAKEESIPIDPSSLPEYCIAHVILNEWVDVDEERVDPVINRFYYDLMYVNETS